MCVSKSRLWLETSPDVFTTVYRVLVRAILACCALQLSIIVNEVRWIHDSQSTIESRSIQRSVDPSRIPRHIKDGPDVEVRRNR